MKTKTDSEPYVLAVIPGGLSFGEGRVLGPACGHPPHHRWCTTTPPTNNSTHQAREVQFLVGRCMGYNTAMAKYSHKPRYRYRRMFVSQYIWAVVDARHSRFPSLTHFTTSKYVRHSF